MKLFELIKREPVDQSLPFDKDTPIHYQKRPETWRGPHTGRHLTLMRAGKKPVAIIEVPDQLEQFAPYIQRGIFTAHRITDLNKQPGTAIAASGEEWRIPRIQKLFDTHGEYDAKGKLKLWHARLGMLLGYSNEDIRKFIDIF